MLPSHTTADAHLRGILFVLSGPSGVGKDTVLRKALPHLGGIRTSISATTRPPRPNERHGVDYFFVTPEEFARLRDEHALLEHAEVHGHCYGTQRAWVIEQLAAGTDVVLEIDVQGAMQVRAQFPHVILIFLAPPSLHELARRLRARQTEDEATVRRRLQAARDELAQVDKYDYLVVNDRLALAVERIEAVVTAERLRPCRQDVHNLLEEEIADA